MGLPDRHEVRVGDDERQQVVDQLRTHFGAGRLTLEEFEDRAGDALASRTVGDLVHLTADLPPLPAARPRGAPVRQRPPRPPADGWELAWRIHLGVWRVLAGFFVVLWLASGAGYFWPIWPILGLGVSVGIHRAVRRAAEG